MPLVGDTAIVVAAMQSLLHARIGFRLPIVIAGAMLARGRRTASSWFRAAGVKDDWDRFYELLVSAGKVATSLALPLLRLIVKRFDPGPDGYLTLAVDDSPTKRFGRHVDAPTFIVIRRLVQSLANGCMVIIGCASLCSWFILIGASLLCLCSRCCMCVSAMLLRWMLNLTGNFKPNTRCASNDQAGEQLVASPGSQAKLLVAFDGAYAAHELISSLNMMNITVVSRSRSNAKLFDLPPARKPGTRGRPRKYGFNRIYLSSRFGHKKGWQSISYVCRGVALLRHCETFLATTSIADGPIGVVIVRFENGETAAYFSTDLNMSVEIVLEAVAGRWAIEQFFHDTEETWGAGKQQVRNVWSSIACWNLNAWLYALVELECWDTEMNQVVDRSDRQWDNQTDDRHMPIDDAKLLWKC